MQSVSSRIWTHINVFISYGDTDYTTGTSNTPRAPPGKVRNCFDAQLGQIVCDKDGVVDWCIVLVEMPLTRFEECWALPTESLPKLP